MHERIDGRRADLLIAGEVPGPDLAGVAEVLAAASAPPSPGELAGEEAAVAAFRAARDQLAGRRRRRDGLSSPIFAAASAKVAVAVIAAVVLGAGVAAGTGVLPSGAQRVAHSAFHTLGVPGPDRGPGRQARPVPVVTTTPRVSAGPTASPTGGGPGPTAGAIAGRPPGQQESPAPTGGAAPLDLCHEYDASARVPMPADDYQQLVGLAGGAKKINGYCARIENKPENPGNGPASPGGPPSHP
ncbi:MAG: hypothetical protein ACJ73S_12010 [Mycobacteriales bacterium]